MERGLSEWRRINVLYECERMNVCMYVINMKNKQKEWHHATKPLKRSNNRIGAVEEDQITGLELWWLIK
jgi:hypothetical protein